MPTAHDARESTNGSETSFDVVVGDGEYASIAEFADGSEHSATIAVLVVAFHFAVGELGIGHFVGSKIEWCANFVSFGFEYLGNFGLTFADDSRNARFDDAGFFECDFGKCGTE